jgi:hypothetical protein
MSASARDILVIYALAVYGTRDRVDVTDVR